MGVGWGVGTAGGPVHQVVMQTCHPCHASLVPSSDKVVDVAMSTRQMQSARLMVTRYLHLKLIAQRAEQAVAIASNVLYSESQSSELGAQSRSVVATAFAFDALLLGHLV